MKVDLVEVSAGHHNIKARDGAQDLREECVYKKNSILSPITFGTTQLRYNFCNSNASSRFPTFVRFYVFCALAATRSITITLAIETYIYQLNSKLLQ